MKNTMRALAKTKAGPGLEMIDAPIPDVGPGEVLIRVRKSAICGTDVHIWNWDDWAAKSVPVPLITGHEFMGEVVDTGPGVTRFQVGQRVSGEGHIVCYQCRNCRSGRYHLCRNTVGVGVQRQGSFAEYIVLPQENVVWIPDDVPDEIAAIFDPFGNAVHTALSFDLVGEDVLVTGAGPIGIMAALVAMRAGARKVAITDINDGRLDLAQRLGVPYVMNPTRDEFPDLINQMGMLEGFDIGLEMSGSMAALSGMIGAMTHGGRIAMLGIPPKAGAFDWNPVIFKMLHIKGIYGREMFETWYKMQAFVQSGLDLSGIITHRLPADAYKAGFDAMRAGEACKVVLSW